MVSGFKESVGFAYRKCRECNATAVQLQEKVCMCVCVGGGGVQSMQACHSCIYLYA